MDKSSQLLGEGSKNQKKRSKKQTRDEPPEEDMEEFTGDETLARSTRFIYDVMVLQEAQRSVRAGDVGRLWKIMKVSDNYHNPWTKGRTDEAASSY